MKMLFVKWFWQTTRMVETLERTKDQQRTCAKHRPTFSKSYYVITNGRQFSTLFKHCFDFSISTNFSAGVMANLIRLAKSGNEWSTNELMAYNIAIVERDQKTFFNGLLPAYTGPTGFVQHEDCVQGLDPSSLALIKPLDLAMKVMDGKESVVDDFAAGVGLRDRTDSYTHAIEHSTQHVWAANVCQD